MLNSRITALTQKSHVHLNGNGFTSEILDSFHVLCMFLVKCTRLVCVLRVHVENIFKESFKSYKGY